MAISRITASIFRSLSGDIIEALANIGVNSMLVETARAPVVEEGGFFGGTRIVDDPVEILSFLVPTETEDQVIALIVQVGRLDLPGRGSVCASAVELPNAENASYVNQVSVEGLPIINTARDVTGICGIVQRGQGNPVGRVALDTGACVPSVTFGTGLGVRDKMSLLRITIPADKELIWTTTSTPDADILFDGMIEAGQLDQPGKGFIFMFPLNQAHLNMDVNRGILHAAASIEQIIVALDGILGDTDWRQRVDLSDTRNERNYLTNLVDFCLICNEGSGDELVGAAMAAGAAGASIAKLKQINPSNSVEQGRGAKPVAREACYMIIGKDAVPGILHALGEKDVTDPFGRSDDAPMTHLHSWICIFGFAQTQERVFAADADLVGICSHDFSPRFPKGQVVSKHHTDASTSSLTQM